MIPVPTAGREVGAEEGDAGTGWGRAELSAGSQTARPGLARAPEAEPPTWATRQQRGCARSLEGAPRGSSAHREHMGDPGRG